MRSNLAELDGLVAGFIANENKAPTVDKTPFIRHIAGFAVLDPDMTTKGEDIRRKQVTAYLQARERMQVMLESKKVTPLAILPAKAWQQICESTGLYRFRMNYDGTISVPLHHLKHFQVFGFIAAWAFWSSLPLAALYTTVIANHWDHLSWGNAISCILCALLCIGYIVMANMKVTPYLQSYGRFARLGSRILNIMPHRWLARRLIPNRVYFCGDERSDARNVHQARANLLLPTPPDSVAETLHRVQGMNGLSTAIVEDGFRFAEQPSSFYEEPIHQDVAHRHIDRENKREERRASWRSWMDQDPIVYIENEGCVAIVAQFGEFPIEREVVETVCANAAYLL